MPIDPVLAKLLSDAAAADPRGIDELSVQEARRHPLACRLLSVPALASPVG